MARSSRNAPAFLSLAIIQFLFVSATSAAPLSFRTVAVTGDPAPGSIPGITFANLSEQPAINNNGSVVFRNTVQLPSGNATRSITTDVAGALAAVMQGGQPAPPPLGGIYNQITSGNISDNGVIGFCSTIDGDFQSFSLYSYENGASSTTAYIGQAAPGVSPPSTFSQLCTRSDGWVTPPSISPGGSMVAYASTTFASSSRIGLWNFSSNGAQLIARASDPAPGAGGTATFLQLGRPPSPTDGYVVGIYPAINGKNQSALYGRLNGTSTLTSRGIWQQVGGALQLAVRSGTQAAGLGAGVAFADFGDPAFNNARHLAFRGVLTGTGVDASNNESVWSNASGALSLVAREGDSAPDVPAGVLFGGFRGTNLYDAILRGNGDAAFVSELTGAGVTPQNDAALWAQRNGVLGLVAREGDAAPGTPAGTLFSDGLAGDFLPYMNDMGLFAFKGSLTGPGVGTANDEGFWAMHSDGSMHLLFREGDVLEVRPGDFRTLAFTNYSPRAPTGGQDGRQRILNNNGELAFTANFTDGSQAVLVFTIPEPASAALMALAWIGLVRRPQSLGRPWLRQATPCTRRIA